MSQALFEDPGSKVDHLHLGNNAIKTLDECQMGRVFFQVILPILFVLEFADEHMRDAILETP